MARLASWLVVSVVLCGLAFVAATSGALPPRVATHFGHGGAANGWMTREGYTWFALGFSLLLPLAVMVSIGFLPARFPKFVNLPHRDHWLAPPRREATLAWLRGFGAAMGLASALFAIGVHALILDANSRAPARLDETAFFAVLAAFVLALVGGTIALYAKFRRIP
ncbi:MAG: hypothetical protein OEV46_09420 [Betaproteobacteria bacterium]|jgi:hypothetical protein|nr:hypothetical protein [Betaproteobacteria bacterium]MDH5285078.1 hypothetical protein [Betaproteobacteria bacterium]